MALFRTPADVSVRPAVPGDERAVARVQVAAWQATLGSRLGPALARIDVTEVESRWAPAVARPPAGHRVLVACDGPSVVGFAAIGPGDGAGAGELLALEVDPPAQRGGHGSRLLAAAVDTLRADGARSIGTWVLGSDEARERFLGAAGLGRDGSERTLATGPEGPVVERHWVAEI